MKSMAGIYFILIDNSSIVIREIAHNVSRENDVPLRTTINQFPRAMVCSTERDDNFTMLMFCSIITRVMRS